MDSSTAERPRVNADPAGGPVPGRGRARGTGHRRLRARPARVVRGAARRYLVLFLVAWWLGLSVARRPSHLRAAVRHRGHALLVRPRAGLHHRPLRAALLPGGGGAHRPCAGSGSPSFVALIGGSLAFFFGPLRGLALGLTSMAIGIVLPASYLAAAEIAAARTRSRAHAGGAAGDERAAAGVRRAGRRAGRPRGAQPAGARAARLGLADHVQHPAHHESVRLLLDRDAVGRETRWTQLQPLTQSALDQMRSLIAHLRPQTSGRRA